MRRGEEKIDSGELLTPRYTEMYLSISNLIFTLQVETLERDKRLLRGRKSEKEAQ